MATRYVPHQLAMDDALRGSEPLVGLLQRVRDSQARLQAIAPLLPDTLRQAVRAGPLDDGGWSLLLAHSAAAAKLRQMLPQLQAELTRLGWPDVKVRLRVLPGADAQPQVRR